jgi:thiopeptide-type bacteriocin biosynthesis protein
MQAASVADTSASSTKSELLYRPLDFVMVRVPLLPVESYLSLSSEESQLSLLSDTRIQRAIAVGSATLFGTVERFKQSGLTPRDAERMRAKLLRYQIRMSTRPTPFGLFAGVALGSWGTQTDLTVRSTCAFTRTRPDMAWLMEFVMAVEANPAIRKRLGYCANPLAVIEADRFALAERAPMGKGGPGLPVSVRATSAVKQALLLARSPIPHETLVARLCQLIPSATPEKVEKLLTELWEQTFLLTDLRPPLTCESPARYVAERLAEIPEAADELTRLNSFLAAMSAWDRVEAADISQTFGVLLAQAGVPADSAKGTPVQVDMATSVEGHMGNALAVEAARAAELLLRLSPSPRGLSSLASYRQSFIGRYGHDREVPLLELLNPHRGLGAPSMHDHGATGPEPAKAAERAQTLLQLACSALHNRERAVLLDEKSLARLETWRPDVETAPLSMDINILVAAASAAAIDNGDFMVVVGPNLGAMAAGRNLGRFADLLGADGQQALERTAAAERAHAPDNLWAELVYLPPNFRSANVVIRPPVQSHEIALGVTAGVPPSNVIPLNELVVGIENNRFYVRWPAADKRVRFSSGHMLNFHNAPPVGRFLVDLSLDGKAVFNSFDWGSVEIFPYLPRVQAGRIVLRPAQWRIQKDDFTIETAVAYRHSLDRWRAQWDVPQHVFLSIGDNRLVLDLDQDAQAAELKTELQKLPVGGSVIVQEVLPRLDEAWMKGPGGHYYSEFIISLVLRSDRRPQARPSATRSERTATSPVAATSVIEQPVGRLDRNYPPGSEWLFVKVYCPRNVEDDIISESMLTFAANVTAAGLANQWFFIRYSDPDSHLRLRFHGSPERLTSQLFGHVCDWARRLMADELCLKFLFDMYEQEVERYGGLAGMAAAEALFAVDSRYSAELLRCSRAKQWPHDRTTLLTISIDDLLDGLGMNEEARLQWYREQAKLSRAEAGADYRERKTVLRSLLGTPAFLANEPGGAEIAGVLQARREALAPVAASLRELGERGELDKSFDELCASFVHLHVNRLGGHASLPEQRILSLLLRTREGLRKSPAAKLDASADVELGR